jgi:hypothetical protein
MERLTNRAFVKHHERQNVVITSANHGNPHPPRLVSAAGFGDRRGMGIPRSDLRTA